MLKSILSVKEKVRKVLEQYPETQDDDKLLWLGVMAIDYNLRAELGEEGYKKFRAWLLKNKIPPFESVRRIRQKFQEGGQFRGTKRKFKMEEESVVREWAKL